MRAPHSHMKVVPVTLEREGYENTSRLRGAHSWEIPNCPVRLWAGQGSPWAREAVGWEGQVVKGSSCCVRNVGFIQVLMRPPGGF